MIFFFTGDFWLGHEVEDLIEMPEQSIEDRFKEMLKSLLPSNISENTLPPMACLFYNASTKV